MSNGRKAKRRRAYTIDPPATPPGPGGSIDFQTVMAVRVGIADLAGDLTSRTHGRASAESVRASCASALREEQNRVTTEKWLRSALLMGWLAGGWLLPKENDDDVRE